MLRPRAHVRSSAGPRPAPSLVWAGPGESSDGMSVGPGHPARPSRPVPDILSPLREGVTALRGVVSTPPSSEAVDHQTDHSQTLRSNTPQEWVVWCNPWRAHSARCLISEWVNGQSGDHLSRPMATD